MGIPDRTLTGALRIAVANAAGDIDRLEASILSALPPDASEQLIGAVQGLDAVRQDLADAALLIEAADRASIVGRGWEAAQRAVKQERTRARMTDAVSARADPMGVPEAGGDVELW